MYDYKLQKINKIPCIISENNNIFTCTILVLVKVGSRYENKGEYGMAHFLEHMLFKGTEKRPSAKHITNELDSIGAQFNAFTGKNMTGYYIKTSNEHYETACDLLSDMIFNSVLDEEEMKKEKNVVIEELKKDKENPSSHVSDLCYNQIFPNTQLGKSTGGEEKDVIGYKKSTLTKFYNKYYNPDNIVIAISGNIPNDYKKLLHKYFKVQKKSVLNKRTSSKSKRKSKKRISKKRMVKTTGSTLSSKIKKMRYNQKKQNVCIETLPDGKQSKLKVSFPIYFGLDDKRCEMVGVLSSILGGYMSSRLFMSLREEAGLAYVVKCANTFYKDIGLISVTAGVPNDKITESIQIIMDELKKIKNEELTKMNWKKR